jgi:thioredoxin reductase (NADPH)
VIIAMGAAAKWLELLDESRFRNRGLSACAVCDGLFFKNQEVMVIGGGDTAIEEALTLAHHASKVTIVHRRDALRACKIMQGARRKIPRFTFYGILVTGYEGKEVLTAAP